MRRSFERRCKSSVLAKSIVLDDSYLAAILGIREDVVST